MTTDDSLGDEVEEIETRWANYCPRCESLEEREYGPGRHATPDRCPDCNWPFNVVDPEVISA
jgi:transposase-like protein